MAETFGDCNGGEKPTKWNTTILRRATDDELKRARSVLAPLENNHDCYRDGCNDTAGDGGETYHYLHRASSPDQQHQYHDPGSPLADNITTLVTGEDISTSSSSTNQQTDNTDDQINLVCREQMPASPLATPPSSPGQNFLDEKTEDCVKPTTTSTDTTSAAAIISKVNLSRCRKLSNSPTLQQQQDFSPPLSSFFPGSYNMPPAAVLQPHSPPGTPPPPPSTTSPTSETPSGITIYRVAPGEEQEEESDNEEEDLEDGELPAQTDDDDDTTLEERASYNTKIK